MNIFFLLFFLIFKSFGIVNIVTTIQNKISKFNNFKIVIDTTPKQLHFFHLSFGIYEFGLKTIVKFILIFEEL